MPNFFNLWRNNKEHPEDIKKTNIQEIRKVKADSELIVYNTEKDWMRIQKFDKNGMEVTYYLDFSQAGQKNNLVKKFIIKNQKL